MSSLPADPAPRVLRCVLFGLLVGGALGAFEAAVRVLGSEDPQVARRALHLVAYGAALGAGFLGLVLGLAGFVAAVAARRGAALSRRSDRPLLVGAASVALLFSVGLVAVGGELATRTGKVRLGGLLALVGGAALVGWGIARAIARQRSAAAQLVERAWRPLAWLCAAGVVLAASLGAASSVAGLPTPGPGGSAPPDAPSVLLVVIDTLRADALGCYGNAEAETPNLDRLAARSVLFEEVRAPASWTYPAVASLLTSTYPWQHGCVDFDRAVSPDLASLPGLFAEAGYASLGVVGNPLVDARRGFARGFHLYDAYGHDLEGRLFVSQLLDRSLRVLHLLSYGGRGPILWFDSQRFPWVTTRLTSYVQDEDLNARLHAARRELAGPPSFLYLQYVAPHAPYLEHPLRFVKSTPPLREEHLDELRARYAREVSYTDRVLGELLARLEEEGVLENTFVVVTSDHGEEFFEHGGWEHGYGLHREVVRVPLIVAGPGIEGGRRVGRPVQLLDVAPTLLELAGIDAPTSFVGRSFAGLLRGEAEGAPPAAAFLEVTSRFLNPEDRYFGVVSGRWKVIRRRDPDGELRSQEAYDLELDPEERTPLEELDELRALLEGLDAYEALQRDRPGGALSPEELERMRALGYGG